MAKLGVIFCLVYLFVIWNFHDVNGASLAKRGLFDSFVAGISDIGSTILPETSMREGCRSVGLYNREKDGGPPRAAPGGGISGMVGGGLARFGNTIFAKSGMEEGCIHAGFYDPNRDAQGNPKNGAGNSFGGYAPQPTIIYRNPPPPPRQQIVINRAPTQAQPTILYSQRPY